MNCYSNAASTLSLKWESWLGKEGRARCAPVQKQGPWTVKRPAAKQVNRQETSGAGVQNSGKAAT